jgi:hypothetical protein
MPAPKLNATLSKSNQTLIKIIFIKHGDTTEEDFSKDKLGLEIVGSKTGEIVEFLKSDSMGYELLSTGVSTFEVQTKNIACELFFTSLLKDIELHLFGSSCVEEYLSDNHSFDSLIDARFLNNRIKVDATDLSLLSSGDVYYIAEIKHS